jgi:hypothetical protein
VRQWLTYAVLLSVVLSIPSAPAARAQEQALSARRVINRVVPQYPQLARSMRIEGTVKLLAVVAPNGMPTSTRVMGGHPVFAKAAVDGGNGRPRLKKREKFWKCTSALSETVATKEDLRRAPFTRLAGLCNKVAECRNSAHRRCERTNRQPQPRHRSHGFLALCPRPEQGRHSS